LLEGDNRNAGEGMRTRRARMLETVLRTPVLTMLRAMSVNSGGVNEAPAELYTPLGRRRLVPLSPDRHHGPMIRTMAPLLFGLFGLALPLRAQQGLEGNELREALADNAAGFWIYDDIEAGFEKARETGKPLLVSFRCVP